MTSLIGTPDYMAPEMAVPSPVTEKVGVLHLGGDTNWFVGQSYRSTFVSGALKNGWWAFTLSDKDSAGNSHCSSAAPTPIAAARSALPCVNLKQSLPPT